MAIKTNPIYVLLLLGCAPAALNAQVITVGNAPAAGTIRVDGQVEAVRQGLLSSQANGRVSTVDVRAGQSVSAGQTLLRIDASDATPDVQANQASLAAANARLNEAEAEFRRAQQLRLHDYISEAALQRAEASLRAAQAEHSAAAAGVAGARTRAAWHTLTAPYAGRVTAVLVSAGDLAVAGKPMVRLYAPGAMRVIAHIPESLGASIQTGSAQVSGSDNIMRPVTTWQLVPAVDPDTHSVEVRADLPPTSSLQPGQFASLWLPSSKASHLDIPLTALVKRSELTAVYVVDQAGHNRLRQIRLGAVQGNRVEVLAGLSPGEQIVADPSAGAVP